jgi:hypothetical protein
MPQSSDAVTKGCVDNNKSCKLSNKCDVCTKEIKDLEEIDSVLLNAIADSEAELINPGAKPSVKKRGRPKTIIKSDIKIIPGPITVSFN